MATIRDVDRRVVEAEQASNRLISAALADLANSRETLRQTRDVIEASRKLIARVPRHLL